MDCRQGGLISPPHLPASHLLSLNQLCAYSCMHGRSVPCQPSLLAVPTVGEWVGEWGLSWARAKPAGLELVDVRRREMGGPTPCRDCHAERELGTTPVVGPGCNVQGGGFNGM